MGNKVENEKSREMKREKSKKELSMYRKMC